MYFAPVGRDGVVTTWVLWLAQPLVAAAIPAPTKPTVLRKSRRFDGWLAFDIKMMSSPSWFAE
jgi:hypothetical protein